MRLFLIFLIYITLTGASRNGWIDPHDMNTNAKQKLERSFSENDKEEIVTTKPIREDNKSNSIPATEESISLMFLKRVINLILNSASADKDSILYEGSYQYKADSEDYKFLIDFSNKKSVNDDEIRRLDTILSTIFAKPEKSIFSFDISKEEVFSTLFHPNGLITFGICFCLLIVYFLLKNNYGFFYIFSYFAFLVLIVDFAERYRFLYEEAEKHNLNILYSTDCDTTKMSWTNYFKFVLSTKDCERKIVTPLEVSLNQVKYIIIIPLESFGTGMGKFAKELWTNLPYPWNILIFPLMLVFISITIFLFTIALRDSRLKLNLLHMLNLELGKPHDDTDRISGQNVDKLLDATTHRRMIEDTRTSPDKKNAKRNKNKSSPKKAEKTNDKQNKEKNGKSTAKVEKNGYTSNPGSSSSGNNSKKDDVIKANNNNNNNTKE